MRVLSAEDRALTLDDTQGMFLLLGAGFLAGAASLFSEWVGGCFRCCKKSKKGDRRDSIVSNPRWHDDPTPREKLNSIQDSNHVVQNYLLKLRSKSEESVRCEVHQNNESDGKVTERESRNSVDYDLEIDRLFNFGHLFGEINELENEEGQQEQIIQPNEK